MDSSPLIVFARMNRLDILQVLFDVVYIPTSVYQETVSETTLQQQHDSIQRAIDSAAIIVRNPILTSTFNRRLGKGEQGY